MHLFLCDNILMPSNPRVGQITVSLDKDHFYMNDVMHCMNSLARKTTSYKYAFFKCILDNLFNVRLANDRLELSFDYLSHSFSKIYWNLASKHRVPQISPSRNYAMGVEYEKLKNDPRFSVEGVDFDCLDPLARRIYLEKTRTQITKYVLFALYDDLNKAIYGYDIDRKVMFFSYESYQFLCSYKDALEKINFYAWIKWTENILALNHSTVDNLSEKLDEEPTRKALDKFKAELLSKGERPYCFYCGKPIDASHTDLDHFIPWHFIKDNQDWNFVFACHQCNSSKSDRIPQKPFLRKIIGRNELILGNSHADNLTRSYDSALRNGFLLWQR